MSTPQVLRCECGEYFTFIRGMVESCRSCGREYKSHRDHKTTIIDDLKKSIKDTTEIYKLANGIK